MSLPGFVYLHIVKKECYCIKVPDGFNENYKGEKFELNSFYRFRSNGDVYEIYSHTGGTRLLVRDKIWFNEHFMIKKNL